MKETAEKWGWPAQLLARMVIGFIFIQAGLNKLHEMNHSKDVLKFFWIPIPAEHRWDPFFPSVEMICGAFLLLGLLTRSAGVLLLGILAAAVFNLKLKEFTGLNLSALQGFTVSVLLAGLCAAGAGAVSLDQLWGKHPIVSSPLSV